MAGMTSETTHEIRLLAVYGSLAPGEVNHGQLAAVKGTWSFGTLRGRLTDAGWGATIGYPGLVLDPTAETLRVQVFESADLIAHLPRLDEFEGPGYRRVVTEVLTDSGALQAWVYVVD